jgi:hypothetical protein
MDNNNPFKEIADQALEDLRGHLKCWNWKKVERINAALRIAIEERTGQSQALSVIHVTLPSTYTLPDLERALELCQTIYPGWDEQ